MIKKFFENFLIYTCCLYAWSPTHKFHVLLGFPPFLINSPNPPKLRVILILNLWGMSDSESTLGTSSFSFNYRSFFLTYPRCGASRQDVLDHLCRLEPSWVYVTVGSELHEDGAPHCHALLCLSKKRDIRNPLHFDYEGSHCNVQPCRNVHDVLAYVQKVTQPFFIN